MKQEGPDGQKTKQETNEETESRVKHRQGHVKMNDMDYPEQLDKNHDKDDGELECAMCNEWYCKSNTTKIKKKHVYTTPVEDGDRMPCWINCREHSRCREECSHDDTEMTPGQGEQQDPMINQPIGEEEADKEYWRPSYMFHWLQAIGEEVSNA